MQTTMMELPPIHTLISDWQVDGWWFHCFRSFIDGGQLARMSGSACKVYLVIKSYTNYKTGLAAPALGTIATKSGLSLAQVKRELNSLLRSGLIRKEKSGRHNVYQIIEHFPLVGSDGVALAMGRWTYVPAQVAAVTEELKRLVGAQSRDNPGLIQIENLRAERSKRGCEGAQIGDMNLASLPSNLRKPLEHILFKPGKLRAKAHAVETKPDSSYPQLANEPAHQ